ncbi:hypothetical protein BDR07DRAFT_1496747 [Suillus spraguei]|nr:hypothetical protein BDR07DRAFT_1496747 [Suillus spraguei]
MGEGVMGIGAGTRQGYPFRPPRSSQPDTSFIIKDLADKVVNFKQSTDTLSPVEITNIKPIASYSWIEAATPMIAVPGSWVMASEMMMPVLDHHDVKQFEAYHCSHFYYLPDILWNAYGPPRMPG